MSVSDVSMKIVKEKIPDKMKIDCWKMNFSNSPFGECPYCHSCIIIPKSIKHKVCPTVTFDNSQQMIHLPTRIHGTHFDHLKSELNYGSTTLDNLYPVCSVCNLQKGQKNHHDFIELIKRDPTFLNSINSDIMYMDIDNNDGICNGIVCDKNNNYKLCKNKVYFRNKCNTHLYQNYE
jgi:5-methylcytosine-specific restriction endonuclease McrA